MVSLIALKGQEAQTIEVTPSNDYLVLKIDNSGCSFRQRR